MALTLVAVFGLFQILLFLIHAVVYRISAYAFGWDWPWLAWLFGILSITFVTSSVFAHKFCNKAVKWFYRLGVYWFGLVMFLFGGSLVFYALILLFYHYDYYISPALLGALTVGGMFLVHTYATWQTSRVKVTRVDITLPHLPEFWQGKKIIFVSDLHLGAARSERFSEKVAAAIGAESPEMVLIGGDLFDGVKCHPMSLLKPLQALKPPQGIYFASGNHEYIGDAKVMLAEIKSADIKVLQNKTVDVKGIQVAGVDWKDTYKADQFKAILAGMHIDKTKPSILMRHEPSHLKVAEEAGISLDLSGHTHAGQIFPLGLITRSMYKGYDYGLKPMGNMMVCTSSGVGTWGPPLRFLTKSEIVAITLH
jgi:hypothetical protein